MANHIRRRGKKELKKMKGRKDHSKEKKQSDRIPKFKQPSVRSVHKNGKLKST